jgi:D-alanyl-D-alanine dipeptidase
MKVQLTASFDKETGDVSAVIRDPDALGPVNVAEVYHRPLLILYTAYRLWAEQKRPEADFRLEKKDFPPDEDVVGKVHDLHKNACNETKAKERGVDHYARGLFQVRGSTANDEKPTGEDAKPAEDHAKPARKVKSLNSKDSIFFTWPKKVTCNSSLLRGRDIIIMLHDQETRRTQELNDVEDLEVFLELLKMNCSAAKRLLFRYRGIRENLVYKTWLADVPFNENFTDEFSTKDYQFFKATADFKRTPFYPEDQFAIGLVETGNHLLKSIGDAFGEGQASRASSSSTMIFREVYSVLDEDRDKLKRIQDEVANAPPDQKEACLDKLFRVRVLVNDNPAQLKRVELESGGKDFSLTYRLPEAAVPKLRLHYRIEVAGFQRRAQNSFPMVISEPTRNVVQEFHYERASIEHVDYFVGATVGPDNTRVTPVHEQTHKYFRATSPEDFFLAPGEGTVVHWTPMERTDRVILVRLNEADHGIIDARYATKDNLFGEPIYQSSELFLVADAAEKLRAVHLQLQREGFRLIIWDAYRPLVAQMRMLDLKPDLKDYMTSPDIGSVHTRGCAVDVTLADMRGKEVKMPTKFDAFYTKEADPDTISKRPDGDEGKKHFGILRKCMEANGFQVRKNEWCHFELRDWRRYPLLEIEPYAQISASPASVKS